MSLCICFDVGRKFEITIIVPYIRFFLKNIRAGMKMAKSSVGTIGFKILILSQKLPDTHNSSSALEISRKGSRNSIGKVSKGAKIRNRYNQVPHLTQDTNGKVTNSQ